MLYLSRKTNLPRTHYFLLYNKCSPYLLLNCLCSPKHLLENFLQNIENRYIGPLCPGFVNISPEKLLENLSGTDKRLCDGCGEQQSVSFCFDCNKVFCEECLPKVHFVKRFQDHKLKSLNQSAPNHFQCPCPGKHYLSHFCHNCQTAICPYCLKIEHEKHNVTQIDGLSQISQEPIQAKIQILKEKCTDLVNSVDLANRKFNQVVEDLILDLQNLKNNNEEQALRTERTNKTKDE